MTDQLVTAQVSPWLVALAVAVAMLVLGMNLGMLAKPSVLDRCGACGRLVRRNRVCPCSRPQSD